MLIAYHGERALKRAVIARVHRHRQLDQIVAGTYWEQRGGIFVGCAVGCTLHSNKHADYEPQLGIPERLAHLQDAIFEGLARAGKNEHLDWPAQFLAAPRVGADLSLVWHQFAAWLILDPEHGVALLNKDDRVAAVGRLHELAARGEPVSDDEWAWAARAAEAAWAARAAWAAWAARAAGAAEAAWAARAAGAAWAARAAGAAWAAGAAGAAIHWQLCRDKLLDLMRNAPVPSGVIANCGPVCEAYKESLRKEGLLV